MKLALVIIEDFETPYGTAKIYHTVDTKLEVREVEFGYKIKIGGIDQFTFGPLKLVGLNGVVIDEYPAKVPMESFIDLTNIECQDVINGITSPVSKMGHFSWNNESDVTKLHLHDPITNTLSHYIRPHKLPFPYITGDAPDHHWGDDDVEKDTLGNMWYLVKRMEGHFRISDGSNKLSNFLSCLNNHVVLHYRGDNGNDVGLNMPVDVFFDGNKVVSINEEHRDINKVITELMENRHVRIVTLAEATHE